MKGILYFSLLLQAGCISEKSLYAQPGPEHLFRIYVDNDYINFRGKGTDRFYTNGVRFDLLYSHRRRPRLLPTSGDSSINISGWSIMQTAIIPSNIKISDYQPDDYPY